MAQMRALETPDPFNDDFYYHNAMRRKQEKSQREALAGQEPTVRVRGVRVVGRGRGVFCFVCLAAFGVCLLGTSVEPIETGVLALFLHMLYFWVGWHSLGGEP